MISSTFRPPERISPDTRASPILPPPRKATRLVISRPPSLRSSPSSPSPHQVRQEEPHIGRSLGQPPGEVGIPLGAVRDVHPDPVAPPGRGPPPGPGGPGDPAVPRTASGTPPATRGGRSARRGASRPRGAGDRASPGAPYGRGRGAARSSGRARRPRAVARGGQPRGPPDRPP